MEAFRARDVDAATAVAVVAYDIGDRLNGVPLTSNRDRVKRSVQHHRNILPGLGISPHAPPKAAEPDAHGDCHPFVLAWSAETFTFD